MVTEKLDHRRGKRGPGKSLALPPIYVLHVAKSCPKCGERRDVYALGCAAFLDAEGGVSMQVFHFLSHVRQLPGPVLRLLKGCAGYFPDRAAEGEPAYLMNHCRCGARFDDDELHGHVGVAFWPGTPGGYRRIKPFQLLITEPIPIECSCAVGGGEYLCLEKAALW